MHFVRPGSDGHLGILLHQEPQTKKLYILWIYINTLENENRIEIRFPPLNIYVHDRWDE